MKTPEEKFISENRSIRLLASERDEIRRRVLHNAPEPAYRPSPYLSFFQTRFTPFAPAFAALFLVVVSVPITYAAQQSTPGDALYAFEVSVVETIEEHLQFSATAKRQYHIERVHERFAEIETVTEGADITRAHESVAQNTYAAIDTLTDDGDEHSDTIDQIIDFAALIEAQRDTEGVYNNLEVAVSDVLTAEVEAYVAETEPAIVLQDIESDIGDIARFLDAADQDASFDMYVQEQTELIAADVAGGDFDEALLTTSEIKVEMQRLLYENPADAEATQQN